MILLDTILLDEDILTKPFSCDVHACKGACCTMKGGSGAPVLDYEIADIERNLSVVLPYLSQKSATFIQSNGWVENFAESGDSPEWGTKCINDSDCVFVIYENDIARCAIEKAYFDKQSDFRKPISCHLFPIRVANFGGDYLYYEQIDECAPAIKHGQQTQLTVLDTARDALERAYGSDWVEAATNLSSQSKA